MFSLKSIWKPWIGGDANKPPGKDEHMVIVDSLMLELEFHIREQEQILKDREQEERRRMTGVDYSWLVSAPVKQYEIPHLERLELEDLCYRVKPPECGKVISLFRDSILNEPRVCDIPKILKACIRQVVEQRPKEETLTDWVTKRTSSLINMKIRPSTKITPFHKESDDVESNTTIETISSHVDLITPSGAHRNNQSLSYHSQPHDFDSLPV
ncbi:protein RD3-like [Mya arenaria]|uniref:protein RD3-like n=1 Tax=Mya arenaria TaxID=6604 RepID=UPI0022E4C31E|nr:protein RD3-like [Mya arenaria]